MNKSRKSPNQGSGSGRYSAVLLLAGLLMLPVYGAAGEPPASKVVYKVPEVQPPPAVEETKARATDGKAAESPSRAPAAPEKSAEAAGTEKPEPAAPATRRPKAGGSRAAKAGGKTSGAAEDAQDAVSRDAGESDAGPVRRTYVYNPAGKPDPFKPFIADREDVEEESRKEPRTYLETLELSQLDLIAIVQTPKGNWAMVRDGKGIGYTVRKGTPIGVHGGVVHKIGGKEMVVREVHRDYKGNSEVKFVRKSLVPNSQ